LNARIAQHVGEQVLDGLERSDGPADLLSVLGVLDAKINSPPQLGSVTRTSEETPTA